VDSGHSRDTGTGIQGGRMKSRVRCMGDCYFLHSQVFLAVRSETRKNVINVLYLCALNFIDLCLKAAVPALVA
jgi:hypothetical protein